MWILGHLGIGAQIARPFARGLPLRWILFGALLPDLIDKPLYYGMSWSSGLRGEALGLVSGTRTFGHTGILILAIFLAGLIRHSKAWAAVALGMATHLLLDGLTDVYFHAPHPSATWLAAFFPFYAPRFGAYPFSDLEDHLRSIGAPFLWGSEVLGAALLWKGSRKNRYRR